MIRVIRWKVHAQAVLLHVHFYLCVSDTPANVDLQRHRMSAVVSAKSLKFRLKDIEILTEIWLICHKNDSKRLQDSKTSADVRNISFGHFRSY